jgi:hypothetical protein
VGGALPDGLLEAESVGRWARLESVLQTARAAEVLTRRGAREPALILYGELARDGASLRAEEDDEKLSVEDRVRRARVQLAKWLRAELRTELDAVRAVGRKLRRSAVVAGVLAVAIFAVVQIDGPGDITAGAHWRASSSYDKNPISGEFPARGFFFVSPTFFFHTLSESKPWLSIDLGRRRSVSAVQIRNRLDCCRERARSLDIEVSRDGKRFERVAKRRPNDEPFRDWKASFDARSARFVRIVGTKDEPLHLADVRIFGR